MDGFRVEVFRVKLLLIVIYLDDGVIYVALRFFELLLQGIGLRRIVEARFILVGGSLWFGAARFVFDRQEF